MWPVIAQAAAPSGGDTVVNWIQFGVLGAVVVALLRGWLWAKPAVDRLLRDLDRERDERSKQGEAIIAELHALRGEQRQEMRELRKEVRRRDSPSAP